MKKLVLALLIVAVAGVMLAGDVSTLFVTKVQVNPLPFKAGDNISFTATVQNMGQTATLQWYHVYLSLYAGEPAYPYTPICKTDQASQGSVAPGATVTVSLPASCHITSGSVDKYCIVATAMAAGNEFAKTYKMCIPATCSYNIFTLQPVHWKPGIYTPIMSHFQNGKVSFEDGAKFQRVAPKKHPLNKR